MPTRLTQTIALLYKMQPADIARLEEQLLDARKKAWSTALRNEAAAHGCNRVPNAPRREDLAELKRMCKEDAKSIAATWNRDVTREIERLFQANRRTNRYYYMKRLEAWDAARREWKLPQIALVNDTTTTEYAKRRFEKMNYDGGQLYQLTGAPPVCKFCASQFAAGLVDINHVRRYAMPAHVGCGHSWTVARRPRMTCDQIWLG